MATLTTIRHNFILLISLVKTFLQRSLITRKNDNFAYILLRQNLTLNTRIKSKSIYHA